MMLREGQNRVRDLLDTNIDRAQFGTGTTAELVTDTALQTPVAATLVTPTSSTVSQYFEETGAVNSVLGNGSTYSEFALRRDSGSRTLSRATFTGLAKASTHELRGRVRYFIK